jgi:hypothetical protein
VTNRIALGAAVVAALALPATAGADHNAKRAKVYRAHLEATAAATTAGIPDVRGRAQLVDGRKKNKVSIHVRGLTAGQTYLWHVHQAKTAGDPCTDSAVGNPTPYPGWEYRALTAGPAGNANSKGKSSTFPLAAPQDTGQAYYVNVHLLDGTVVACGVLERKARTHESRGNARGHGKQT